MMIMRLDYVFDPLPFFSFVRSRVRNFIFYIFYQTLTPLHLNRKIQKMNRHRLGNNLDVSPQNSKFFLQILMIVLKIDVTLKSFLAMQFSIIM